MAHIETNTNPYAGVDYTQFLGTSVNDDPNDPFKGGKPTNHKEYLAYRAYHEDRMAAILGGQGTVKLNVACEFFDDHGKAVRLHRPKKEHFGCGIVFCCDHVIFSDRNNPEGIWFVPIVRAGNAGYWLCKTCFRLYDRKRLDMEKIFAKCSRCVFEAITSISEKYPDRLHNLADQNESGILH